MRDDAGGLWRFATQDAEFAPADPSALLGRTLKEARIDPITTELRFRFSDGAKLVIAPGSESMADDPPSWELITPDHLTLEFGSGLRWQIGEFERS